MSSVLPFTFLRSHLGFAWSSDAGLTIGIDGICQVDFSTDFWNFFTMKHCEYLIPQCQLRSKKHVTEHFALTAHAEHFMCCVLTPGDYMPSQMESRHRVSDLVTDQALPVRVRLDLQTHIVEVTRYFPHRWQLTATHVRWPNGTNWFWTIIESSQVSRRRLQTIELPLRWYLTVDAASTMGTHVPLFGHSILRVSHWHEITNPMLQSFIWYW